MRERARCWIVMGSVISINTRHSGGLCGAGVQQLALHAPLNIGLVVLVVDYYYIDTTIVSASMATGAAATTDRNKNTREKERKAIKENSQVAQPLDPRRNPPLGSRLLCRVGSLVGKKKPKQIKLIWDRIIIQRLRCTLQTEDPLEIIAHVQIDNINLD